MGISDEKIQRINELARRSTAEGLTEAEKKYLNEYHEMVYQKLASGLEPEVAAWLREITLPIA